MSLSTVDTAVVKREAEVPGLGYLLNADRMHALLASRICGIGEGTLDLGYLRYKPGMNCLAAFELSTGHSRLRGYAKALRPADAAKLEKKSGKIVPGEHGAGRLVFEEPAILVHLHPNDRKLRSLRHVGSREARERILRRVCTEHTELAEADLLRLAYKPERRFVGQLYDRGRALAVLKLYSKAAFARRNTLLDAGRTTPGLRLPRVLGVSKRNSFLVLEWLRGDLLREVLRRPEFPAGEVSEVGAALAEFHRLAVSGVAHARRAPLQKALCAATDFVAALDPDHSHVARSLLARLSEPLDGDSRRERTLHGDLHAKQVLIDGGRVALIDLDTATSGEPELDLGNFVAHLVRDGIGGRIAGEYVDRCRDELLSGYRRAGGRIDERRLDLHVAAALVLLAPHPFRVREPEWRRRTRRILERASRLAERATVTKIAVGASLAPHPGCERVASQFERTLELLIRDGPAAARGCAIHRVDLVGGAPLLTVGTPSGTRWFRARNRNLREFVPATDPKLPLAKGLEGGERVLAYRPLRRLVVKCETDSGPLIIKGYRRGRAARMEALYGTARQAATNSGFRVPAVLARAADSESLLFEYLPGRRLPADSGSGNAYRAVGAALARFQSADTNGHLSHFSASDELAVLDAWSARLQELGDRLPNGWDETRRALDSAEVRLPAAEAVPTHRDLHDGQFLDSDDGLALLDFDLLCRADAALDPANLLCHFELRALQRRQSEEVTAECRSSFMEGFAVADERCFDCRLAFYQTTTYLRLALVYALRPRWRSLRSSLTDRARRTLDEARAS